MKFSKGYGVPMTVGQWDRRGDRADEGMGEIKHIPLVYLTVCVHKTKVVLKEAIEKWPLAQTRGELEFLLGSHDCVRFLGMENSLKRVLEDLDLPVEDRREVMVMDEDGEYHKKGVEHPAAKIIEINGVEDTVKSWCKIYGISRNTVYSRINTGWDITEAITVKPGGKRTIFLSVP